MPLKTQRVTHSSQEEGARQAARGHPGGQPGWASTQEPLQWFPGEKWVKRVVTLSRVRTAGGSDLENLTTQSPVFFLLLNRSLRIFYFARSQEDPGTGAPSRSPGLV